jgi:hypothetical protein
MTKQEKLIKYTRLGLDKIKAGQMDAERANSLLIWLRVAENLPDSDQFNLIMSWFENEMLEVAAE